MTTSRPHEHHAAVRADQARRGVWLCHYDDVTTSRLHNGGRPRNRALALVIARDGDRCRRCGHVVNLELGGLHPDGPTLGHVIPAARGGGDDLANLALEHRRCNLAAGSRLTPPRAAIVAPIRTE